MENISERKVPSSKSKKILIIGGGWSGLAAAIRATQIGHQVTLLESSPQLGGRARACPFDSLMVDNGQHLLMGAYTEFLSLLSTIGQSPEPLLMRTAPSIVMSGQRFLDIKLPAQLKKMQLLWSGLMTSGVYFSEKQKLARFLSRLKSHYPEAWHSVFDWLRHEKQPMSLIEHFWEPLCLAAMSTPTDIACAQTFHHVLTTILLGAKGHSDFLFPRCSLSELFPSPANTWLKAQGARVLTNHLVEQLCIENGCCIGADIRGGEHFDADAVFLATAPRAAQRLIAPHPALAELDKKISALEHQSIATLYLQYPEYITLQHPMIGTSDPVVQWVFDRGITHQTPGLLAVVMTGNPFTNEHYSKQEISYYITAQLGELFPFLAGHKPKTLWIQEKHAAFQSVIGHTQFRPQARTNIPGLWLCGDYCQTKFPATLEGAIRSGVECAQLYYEDQKADVALLS